LRFEPGELYMADPGKPHPTGHEQLGDRPYVIVAVPSRLHRLRYPMVIMAPLTTAQLPAQVLYPRLEVGTAGLRAASTVLLDQIIAMDPKRIRRYVGKLEPSAYLPIEEGIRRLFCSP
jgi:mRNA interferase MazF